jgi:glycine/D-amino acid oxidase-like deaminating enzyme
MLSFWEQQSFTSYNYAVVGGGLVGISTALSIKELIPKASVAVLERGVLPSGASTRNAGFACFGSLSELWSDIEQMGEASARQLVQDRWSGLQLLRNRLGDSNLQYKNYGGYELLFDENVDLLDRLEQVNEWLWPLFNQPVFQVNHQLAELFGFNGSRVATMVCNPLEGQIHTGAMMKSLIALAREHGVEYLTGATMEEWDAQTDSITLMLNGKTDRVRIQCDKLAICTNAFSNHLLPDLEIRPGRGIVLLTKEIPELKFKGAFHYHQGYYYFRNVGKRVLFGGGRNLDFSAEETLSFGINHKILAHLESELHQLILPGLDFEIDQWWSGIMAFGPDKRPLVGLHTPRVGYAVGLGGMGVALGSLVGDQLAKLICFSEND